MSKEIVNEGIVSPSPTDSNTDINEFDIDKIFGNETAGDDKLGDGNSDKRAQPPWKSDADAFSDVKEAARAQEAATKKQDSFDDQQQYVKNPQLSLSKLQSERDVLKSELEKVRTQATDWKTAYDFLGELDNDAEIRRAYFAELEPELFKPSDPYSSIKTKLEKEFGDFTPNPDEVNIFGSKTMVYNERAKDLLSDAREKAKALTPGNLKEIRSKRKSLKEKESALAITQKQDIMKELDWTETTWDGFANYMQVTQGMEFAKTYNYMLRKSSTPQPLATQTGKNWKSGQDDVFKELNEFYG